MEKKQPRRNAHPVDLLRRTTVASRRRRRKRRAGERKTCFPTEATHTHSGRRKKPKTPYSRIAHLLLSHPHETLYNWGKWMACMLCLSTFVLLFPLRLLFCLFHYIVIINNQLKITTVRQRFCVRLLCCLRLEFHQFFKSVSQ